MTEYCPPQAALDVGSNTIRLLVAVPHDGDLVPLTDQSEFVRLGLGVDRSGELQPEREHAAITAIQRLASLAKDLGAGQVTAVATSAVRDARNGRTFVEDVRRQTGVTVRIVSGEEEAELTFLGATLGLTLDGGSVVVDLGGGSAEVVAAEGANVRWLRSLPIGSGRLTEECIHHDPPRDDEIDCVRREVRHQLARLPAFEAQRGVFTGGTATHVVVLAGEGGPVVCLAPARLDVVLQELISKPQQAIVARGVRPERAAVLPAGVAALVEIVRFYELPQVVITQRGIREGVILASIRHLAGF